MPDVDADNLTARIDSVLGEVADRDNEEFLGAAAQRALQESEE